LIGCCTAATVFSRLGRIERQLSVPIIYPTALAAVRATRSKRIGVIATQATVRAHAFRREILALDPMCLVTEKAAQELVSMVESGEEDPLIIGGILEEFRTSDIDTLILGCTHFPYLASAIGSLMPEVTLVSCARAAAESISPLRSEMGRTLVLLPNGDTGPLTQ
jgi:glutamate racemase